MAGLWFSPGITFSSTNKTDSHNIVESGVRHHKKPTTNQSIVFGMNRDGIYLFLVGVKQQSLIHSIPRYLILDWHIIVWS